MTRGEIRTYARRLLAELVPDESFWDEPTLDDFIARGYEDVCVRAELLQCWSVGGVVYVPGEVHGEYLFPTDVLRVLRAYYRDARLRDATVEELEREDPAWHTRVADLGSQPVAWAPGGDTFFLYPAPSETAQNVLRIRAIQVPAPLGTDGASPRIPLGYHEAIALAAAIRALTSDRTSTENERALRRLEGMYVSSLAWAQAQHAHKGPAQVRLRDIRDYYPTTSGWRT